MTAMDNSPNKGQSHGPSLPTSFLIVADDPDMVLSYLQQRYPHLKPEGNHPPGPEWIKISNVSSNDLKGLGKDLGNSVSLVECPDLKFTVRPLKPRTLDNPMFPELADKYDALFRAIVNEEHYNEALKRGIPDAMALLSSAEITSHTADLEFNAIPYKSGMELADGQVAYNFYCVNRNENLGTYVFSSTADATRLLEEVSKYFGNCKMMHIAGLYK